MAKIGYAGLCLFVLLVTLAWRGHGSVNLQAKIGSIHMFNDADHDILMSSKVHMSDGGSTTDTIYSTLPKWARFNFDVMDGIDCVTTKFKMPTPEGEYDQLVADWCSLRGSMPIPCLPNCFWAIDENGFFVANSEQGQLQFVTRWKGPDKA